MSVSERLRLAALSELGIVGTSAEERFDRITRIAKELFHVPIAEINFIDRDSQFTKSPQRPGGSTRRTPRADSFCDVVVQQPDMVVVPDALEDPRFASRGTVTGTPHVRFYAGRPLSLAEGVRVGTICLVDTEPRVLDSEEADLLDELGLWVERELRDIRATATAAATQKSLLPEPLQLRAGYSFAGYSQAYFDVAGDYFAWDEVDGRVDVTLADVMGKGPAAAIVASAIRSAFQARPREAPAEAVDAVNEQLLRDFSTIGTFATLFRARVDTTTGAVEYADAGHGLTLVVRSDGSCERLSTLDLPLGISGDAAWEAHSTRLGPGDLLLSCTDGALDLFDGTLDALDRLAALVRAHPLDDGFFADVAALVAEAAPEDDVTVVVIRRDH